MSRSEEHKKYLSSLSENEKAILTSYREFEKRKNIVKKYHSRHLVRNELPNNVWSEELVLFYKKQYDYPPPLAWAEYWKIRQELSEYLIKDKPLDERSVKYRYHIHFIK